MKKRIEIYDTTLRDGAQQKGIIFSLEDKIKIIKQLINFGIDFIEAGWPGSNPKDTYLFKKISSLFPANEKIVAFGMTCKKDKKPSNDPGIKALLEAKTKIITVVGKSCLSQVTKILKIKPKENLKIIEQTIRFLKQKDKKIFFDAEHFFDGFKNNPQFALLVLKTAQKAGAERIILCDTNGGTLPMEIRKIIKKVKKEIKTPLGIHCHNDTGLAIANTLEGVNAGITQIQGTINGYGERCGNADLCAIIPTLFFKLKIPILNEEKIKELKMLSRIVAQIANRTPDPFQPYVGENAFLTKAGLHGDGLFKWKNSYLHIDPEKVGNQMLISISELSGKSNILMKASQWGLPLSKKEAQKILWKIKKMENEGWSFENAEASLELFLAKEKKVFSPLFRPLFFEVKTVCDKKPFNRARVRILIKNKIYSASCFGIGPVNALDKALRMALYQAFPQLKKIKLIDYKVRIPQENGGTRARVIVFIESSDGLNRWITVGVSRNIILASWQALLQSLEYPLYKNF